MVQRKSSRWNALIKLGLAFGLVGSPAQVLAQQAWTAPGFTPLVDALDLEQCLADAEEDKRIAADDAVSDARICLGGGTFAAAGAVAVCFALSGPGAPGCAAGFAAAEAAIIVTCAGSYVTALGRIERDFDIAKERCERDATPTDS